MKPTIRRAANAVLTYGWTFAQSALAIGDHAIRNDPEALRNYERRWANGLLRMWGIEVSVEGLEHVPTQQRLVMVCNHQSYIDVVALFSVLPELPVFLAKKELRRVPLFGRAMESIGHVFVDRGRRDRALEAIDTAAHTVRPGLPVVVFPEGTRTRRPVIQPFKKGAFHLAKSAAAPILPMGIVGSLEAWPRGTPAPSPGKVSLRIGTPIPSEDVASLEMEALVERTRLAVAALTQLPLSARADETQGR